MFLQHSVCALWIPYGIPMDCPWLPMEPKGYQTMYDIGIPYIGATACMYATELLLTSPQIIHPLRSEKSDGCGEVPPSNQQSSQLGLDPPAPQWDPIDLIGFQLISIMMVYLHNPPVFSIQISVLT